METRGFGRTGHLSSAAIFGAYAVSASNQDEADQVMEKVIAAGVNHIDVAPSYGDAEERLGPWMARHRDRFFLGCKTRIRDKTGAAAELEESLKKLQTDHFDLYQIHGISRFETLDKVTGPGGALEAIIEAREAGLTNYIGITGHHPAFFIEALKRFDFDSVLFPLNFIMMANEHYRACTHELLRLCREMNVGSMIIKSVAASPWGDDEHTHDTWYRPFTDPAEIKKAVDFALSQDITGICTAGDPNILPLVLNAAENFTPMDTDAQAALMKTASGDQAILPLEL